MRRSILVVLFLTVVASVLLAAHFYIAQRLVFDLQLSSTTTSALNWLVVALAISLIAQQVTEHSAPPRVARLIAWPASLWGGLAFLLLVTLLASDLTWTLLGAAFPGDRVTTPTIARLRALGVILFGLTATGIGARAALAIPRVRRIEISPRRWPTALDGFRIVQISDIHIGPLLDRHFAKAVTDRCNELDADLLVITGDLVDGNVLRIADEVAPFGKLRARHGVFFVTGNHDYFSGVDPWVDVVGNLGIRPLRNEHITIEHAGAAFHLAGVEDHHAPFVSSSHRSDVAAAITGCNPDLPVVLLAHDPLTFPEAIRHAIDLQISGHTHGGQIWPFRFLVRLTTPFVEGLYKRGNSQIYVSRGTGFWGPPIRLRAPSEITEIVLRAASARCAT